MTTTDRQARPVVVGIDGSDAAIDAARWGLDEAVARSVALRLIHVMSGDSSHRSTVTSAGILYFVCVALHSGKRGVNVQTAVRQGDSSLVLIAESRRAAVICVGSTGIGHAAGRLVGSSAVALAKHAHCPVAIIRANHDPSSGERVVAVLDRHPDSDEVLHHALEEARLRRAPLLVLGVHRWDVGAMSGPELARHLDNWLPRYPEVSVHSCVTGTATEYLVTRDETVQLLVTGGADANNLTRLVGPHGAALASYPNCSVLVVRADQPKKLAG